MQSLTLYKCLFCPPKKNTIYINTTHKLRRPHQLKSRLDPQGFSAFWTLLPMTAVPAIPAFSSWQNHLNCPNELLNKVTFWIPRIIFLSINGNWNEGKLKMNIQPSHNNFNVKVHLSPMSSSFHHKFLRIQCKQTNREE